LKKGAPSSQGRAILPFSVLARTPHGEATDLIDFAGVIVFLLAFSAQKTHVKSPTHLTLAQSITSAWHVSSTQLDILDIDRKREALKLSGAKKLNLKWGGPAHNPFVMTILDVTHLL
jgi:hypothetical protein